MSRVWDRLTCRECLDGQAFDPFFVCPECDAYYRAPLRWVEEHLNTEGDGDD